MEQKDYVVEDTVIETEKKDQSAEVLAEYAKKLADVNCNLRFNTRHLRLL